MRTLVVSDLHLGGRTGVDVLRDPVARESLLVELARTSRLVLLGDTLELRHGPAREALARARPALEAIGAALPAGAEVVLVPGNHDHALAAPWLDSRAQRPLGHETRVKPGTASALARQVAGWLGGAADHNVAVEIAYPGVWLRPDVYAMHGHYLDPHGTVPTFERLAAGAMSRMVGAVPGAGGDVVAEDYERVLAPLYAWITSAAQRAGKEGLGAGAGRAGKAYELLQGDGHQPVRARLLTAIFPLGIRGLNLLGIGPVRSDLSGDALRRNALDAFGEVVGRLGIEAEHVIFGHSHRAGPLPEDDVTEWRTPSGAWLHNSGSWVHEPVFTQAAGTDSPYWPGGAILVEDTGAPQLLRLLADDDLVRADADAA
ncbi:MAG TPA: metallophosphoesterase [Baekduia sp.]|nr:metallophosphoesterase [Baekduia sp.]